MRSPSATASSPLPLAAEEPGAKERPFAWGITAAFVLLTLPRLFLHELWRDEAWLWLVATESRSFSELFGPLARSGQGNLFPVLCFLASRLSDSPRAMQLLHLLVAGAAVYVFARRAPFGRTERALFVLGYFPFYEYAVISRHYAAGALLVWLACAAACSRRPFLGALGFGAALGLLAQTTVYGCILALALAAGWLLLHRPGLQPRVFAGATLAAAGLAAGIVQIIPLPGTSFAPGWRFGWTAAQAGEVLALPWRAFVPLPPLRLHFWNHNLLDARPAIETAAGGLVLLLAAALLWRRKAALATFALGAAGLLAFGYVKYAGVLRHQGHLWLLFAAALWLGGAALPGWRLRVLRGLLAVHCGAGLYASAMDLRHPFSNGTATAELIRGQGWQDQPLFGHREPPAASVSLALGRPLYSPSREKYVRYPDWGPEQRELSDPQVRCAARALARLESRDVLLVINRALPAWEELEPAGERTGALVATEDYFLYWLRLNRLEATAGAARCAERRAAGPGARRS